MTGDDQNPCILYPILTWDKGGWAQYHKATDEEHICEKDDHSEEACLPDNDLLWSARVKVIVAHADAVRVHEPCRAAFTAAFRVPKLWWTKYCRRANGYFGCETQTDRNGEFAGLTSWARFMVKVVEGNDYAWYKINMFTHWEAASGKSSVIIFDPPDSLMHSIRGPLFEGLDPQELMDPFWIYARILEDVVDVQNKSVWDIRTPIREAEKAARRDLKKKPSPDYASLHELARHAIHGNETLDLAAKTARSIIQQHEAFRNTISSSVSATKAGITHASFQRIHERMLFFEHMIESLRMRATSNKQRLDNEIQLAFNRVAQYDTGLTVKIGQDTRSDSQAMRTIAFVTLTFLPATFIAAIFSTSFFQNEPGTEWNLSPKFWIYWVFAIPITIATGAGWMWWQKLHAKKRQKKAALIRELPANGSESS